MGNLGEMVGNMFGSVIGMESSIRGLPGNSTYFRSKLFRSSCENLLTVYFFEVKKNP